MVQWDFAGTLASSNGGHTLTPGFAAPADKAAYSFTTDRISGQQAKVARFERGTYFRLEHGFAPNRIGFIDRYTLVMDVRLDTPPRKRRAWRALLQTQHSNNGDADWGINRKKKLGTSRIFGGTVVDGQWHRLAFVYDITSATATSYINGKRVSRKKRQGRGSRYLLEPTLLLFGDNDKENIGGWVSSVQLHDRPLSDSEIAALGGPSADGIPRKTASAPSWTSNTQQAAPPGSLVRLRWKAGEAPQGQVHVVVTRAGSPPDVVATVQLARGAHDWRVDPWAAPGTHKVHLAWGPSHKQRTPEVTVAVGASGEKPPPRPAALGKNLVAAGDFEAGWDSHWRVIDGAVEVREGRLTATKAGDFRARQDIALSAHPGLAAAAGKGLTLEARGQLGSQQPAWRYDDQAWFEVSALNGRGEILRTFASLHDAGPDGVVRLAGGHLPATTEKLRVEVRGRHLRGRSNSAWLDAIDVRLRPHQMGFSPLVPAITKGPFLQDVRGDVMTIMWETNFNPKQPVVSWAPAGKALQPRTSGIETRRMDRWRFLHIARLDKLLPETRYRYTVGADGVTSRSFGFRTAPKDATPFSIAWMADNQYGWRTFRTILPKVARAKPDLAIFAGDIVQHGYDLRQWHTQWFESLAVADFVATTPLVFARGNHDGEWPFAYGYSVLPDAQSFYSFTYGNTFIIALDTESNHYTGPRQHQWLKQQLKSQAYRDAAFRIVTMHKPPYTNLWDGRHKYDGEKFVREKWVPLFERARVDLVVGGHAHAYERGRQKGVTYVVVGGAGGRLDDAVSGEWDFIRKMEPHYHYNIMSVSGGRLEWKAFKRDGKRLDRFVLRTRNKAWKKRKPGLVGQ